MPPKKNQKKKRTTQPSQTNENESETNQTSETETKKEETSEEKKLTANLMKQMVIKDRQTIIEKDLATNLVDTPHDFWDTQPVPRLNEVVSSEISGPIDAQKTVDDIRKNPYNLPDGYEWCETDVNDEKTLSEVYELLNQNYVEDDDNMFRFDYSKEFLKWATCPPGYLKQWHIGVRISKNKKLMGFITAIPALISIYDKVVKMVEINFLCVHKVLRDKRLAPVLIKEITRRVNLENIWQATYTAGRVIPKPIASCRYYHRSLNPKKLIDIGFSHLNPKMTLMGTIKFYKVPEKPQCSGIRPMEAKDVPSVTVLLNNYLKAFDVKQVFDEAEIAHWLLPRPDVINSYVIENPETKQITDLTSFYTLPSSIIGNQKYKTLRAAYSYYNVATTIPLQKLIGDALILAKKLDYDVMNCLDVMENETFLKDLKFGKGDGTLQYYLYNWRCKEMEHNKVGLVLL